MLPGTRIVSSPCAPELRLPAARRLPLRLKLLVLSLVLSLALVAPVAFNAPTVAAQQRKAQTTAATYFVGEVEYKVTAGGSNREGIESFKAFSPTTFKIIYGRQGFRLIETGGLENNVLLNYAKGEAYLLDARAKTATKVFVMNLDDEEGAKLASILPYHYKTDMEPTGKTGNVAGHACREYRVLKSAFIRPDAAASLCVAETVKFKLSRYNFENESSRVTSPLPLTLPVPLAGAILRMEIKESGVEAVYEVVRITPGAPGADLFSVPGDYKVKPDK